MAYEARERGVSSSDCSGVWGFSSTVVAISAVSVSWFLLFPACTLGPNYRRPNVNTRTAFRGASGAAERASFGDLPWWDVFKDETLTELVKAALANNYDLAAAVARVDQSREIAAQARALYFPAVNYSSILTHGHNQFTGGSS